MKMKEYEIESHGVEFPDYFQGAGISGTGYSHIATGIGDTEREALVDALDIAAQEGYGMSAKSESDELLKMRTSNITGFVDGHGNCPYWHVSIRWN